MSVMNKPFVVTDEMRDQVETLAAVGMSATKIGTVLRCCQHTILRHFADELENGLARRQAEAMLLLVTSARSGNVAAQRHLAAALMARDADLPVAAGLAASAGERAKLGKKAARKVAAQEVASGNGSTWGDDLAFDAAMPN